jgi:hypothetical protein
MNKIKFLKYFNGDNKNVENLLWEHERRISKIEGMMYVTVTLQIATFILLLKFII